MANKKNITFNFEAALEKLNNLVSVMERGDLDLETSLKNFEQGIKLIRECQQALKQAEQKVQILVAKEKQTFLQSYEPLSHPCGSEDPES